LRWGIVGTGSIANQMAPMIRMASTSELAAVSSRSMKSAEEFASEHGADAAFDSWLEMIASPRVDAVYIATPTSVREEIAIVAASNGKHVLAEKPFSNLASLQRITAACNANDVGFMDGTHFVHHPRTARVRASLAQLTGDPWSLDSAFQVNLADRGNIRFNPELEPLGAVGDLGWYNMRAAVEYLAPDAAIASAESIIRRDAGSGAAISGSGVIGFDDGSSTTWNCAFDSGALVIDLRMTGKDGVIAMSDFMVNRPDGSAAYTFRKGGFGANGTTEVVEVASSKPGAALMFEDFASMLGDPAWLAASVRASERTQLLLDTAWQKALKNERVE
jgi:predicted dehydrogenase